MERNDGAFSELLELSIDTNKCFTTWQKLTQVYVYIPHSMMQMDQKYEFFAPIWRVMRDNNMSVEEVKEQVSYVALVTKQASTVSDLRQHVYSAPKTKVRLHNSSHSNILSCYKSKPT